MDHALLILSEDGDIGCVLAPSPFEKDVILLTVRCFDLQLPSIPLPLSEVQAAMEVWFGDKKATIKTLSNK